MNVVFAHNVYNRLVTLRDTITIEKKLFPQSKVSVAYNDSFINIFNELTDIEFIKFNEKPHKVGCVNGSILSIQNLLQYDFDVLIFSHDDVYINEENLDVVNNHIISITSGEFDAVCRTPRGWGNYSMMEIFYISKKAAIKLFQDLVRFSDDFQIPVDSRNSPSPEVWLYNILHSKDLKINEIIFESRLSDYNIQLSQQMGYLHKNYGLRGWRD